MRNSKRKSPSENEDALRISIIILAAGASSRMGQSKQLLIVNGEQLLRRTARIAISSNPEHVVVVLGANEEEHQNVIHDLPVNVVHHAEWKKGMGGSLRAGLKYVLKISPLTEAVIILVCDQPLLSAEHIHELKRNFQLSGSHIVASAYADTLGVPALFDKTIFDKLLTLQDDQGARKVIRQHSSIVYPVAFSNGEVDLDTFEDYENFTKKSR